jgi:hypothetical protein
MDKISEDEGFRDKAYFVVKNSHVTRVIHSLFLIVTKEMRVGN